MAKRSFGPDASDATPFALDHLALVSYAPGGGTVSTSALAKRRECELNVDDDLAASRPSTRPFGAPPAPPCARCGAPRWFEFQILPQLLGAIEPEADGGGGGGGGGDGAAAANPLAPSAGSLDWGTACVYTCSASCAAADGEYAEEFVWHQAL